MTEDELSKIIIGHAIRVHKALGPGLLEGAYEECLCYELRKAGINTEKQKILPLIYDDIQMISFYRIDLLVENKVILEIKAVEAFNEIHMAQILTYLRLSNCKTWSSYKLQCTSSQRRDKAGCQQSVIEDAKLRNRKGRRGFRKGRKVKFVKR